MKDFFKKASKPSPVRVYAGLRKLALETPAPQLAGVTREAAGEPYGVLMETGYAKGTATLAAFASGDASLYFSNGGGVLGGIGHEKVREAARQLVTEAKKYTARMERVTAYPLPGAGRVRFYVMTAEGIVTAEEQATGLEKRKSELAPLFFAGHAVITELRLITEQKEE